MNLPEFMKMGTKKRRHRLMSPKKLSPKLKRQT